MGATSLVQFMDHKETSEGDPVHWGRADIDGLPFRGQAPPPMAEEELQARLKRVADPQVRVFDMSSSDDVQAYRKIMARITNGWAQGIHVDRQFVQEEKKWLVYIEWADWYMQDGAPNHSQNPYVGKPNHA